MIAPPSTGKVDLRSDTVTLPTEAMYERMRRAPLGDDGLDGDPTARELEAFSAALLGKAAGLYAPSVTMANLLAILAQVDRQSTVLAGSGSHIYTVERGAATFTGAFYQPVPDWNGAMDLTVLEAAFASSKGQLKPALVCGETSHNNEGGAVASLGHMSKVYAASKKAGVQVHLDGARLFNAALSLGVAAADLAAQADTVSICLSKGLSAPMGAVLVGPEETISRARWLRKLLGASQRQVGIAAAAGLEGLQAMVQRLPEDHRNAIALADGLAAVSGLRVRHPQTNIVQVDVSATAMNAIEWEAALRQERVLVRPWGVALLRCVTHRHISAASVVSAIAAFSVVSQSACNACSEQAS